MNEASKSRLAKIITKQLSISFAALFFVDVLLWVFFPIHVDTTAIKWVADQSVPGLNSNIVYERNRYGFRSLSMQHEKKPADTIRIFCLGASTTDQLVQNTEDTWCALLEKKLNEEFLQSKVRVETASFGRGGWKPWFIRGESLS